MARDVKGWLPDRGERQWHLRVPVEEVEKRTVVRTVDVLERCVPAKT